MSLYEQHVDGVKVGRAFTVDGTDDDARLAALAATGIGGWRLVDEDVDGVEARGSAPSTPQPQPEQVDTKRPPQSANKDAWVDWAVSNGMDREAAEDLTKAQLIELADQLAKE